MTSTGVVTIWENVSYRNTAGKIVTEELTISKQTTSDVYCLPCHDVGEYFRMEPETFYDHLKRKHNSILSPAVSCNLCHQKIQQFECREKTSFKTKGTQIQRHSGISTPSSSRLQSKEHSCIPYECARYYWSFQNAPTG